MHSTNDQSGALSQGTIQKIEEFKRLMNKYSQYHQNPDGIIKYVVWSSINGDNKPLDEKLAQLNKIDAHQSLQTAIKS